MVVATGQGREQGLTVSGHEDRRMETLKLNVMVVITDLLKITELNT